VANRAADAAAVIDRMAVLLVVVVVSVVWTVLVSRRNAL